MRVSTLRLVVVAAGVIMALVLAPRAEAQVAPEVESAFERARSYEFGRSRTDLSRIARAVDGAASDGERRALEAMVLDLIADPSTTHDARRFGYAQLGLVGSGAAWDLVLERAMESDSPTPLMSLLAEVGASEAAPELLEVAASSDNAVRRLGALQALAELAQPEQIAELVEVGRAREGRERDLIGRALATAGRRARGNPAAIAPLVEALARTDPPESAALASHLLIALGHAGGELALGVVRSALRQQDRRPAAILALASWPDDGAIPVLVRVVERGESVEKAPAWNSLMATARRVERRSAEATVALLRTAIEHAPGREPRLASIAALAEAPHPDGLALALRLATSDAEEPDAARAAASAAVRIAGALGPAQAASARAAVEAIRERPELADALRAEIGAALDRLERDADFILAWRVAGPFRRQGVSGTTALDAVFVPETEPGDPATLWVDAYASRADDPGRFDLAALLGSATDCAGYARTSIWSPVAQDARLDLGSDDGLRVWLNGRVIHTNNAMRGLTHGSDRAAARLERGWNDVLVKVSQGGGDWQFSCRMRAADGSPLRGVFADPHRRRREAPADAIVLLGDAGGASEWQHRDGRALEWEWFDSGGEQFLTVKPGSGDALTRRRFEDFTLHVEFMCPEGVDPAVAGQARSNSGVYLLDSYEVQVLDSWGLAPMANGCGAIYGVRAPTVNASRRAGEWQTYDIEFTAARWDDVGAKVSEARLTVWHNGVLVHRDVPVSGATGAGGPEKPGAGPIRLQDHGNAVRYRNIWVLPHEGWVGGVGAGPSLIGPGAPAWEQRGGQAEYRVEGGEVIGRTVRGEPNSFLCTEKPYGDVALEYEFLVDGALNSGVQVRSRALADGRVHGYQIEIDPSDRAWTAGVYEEAGRGWLAPLEAHPAARAAFRPGAWNRVRVVARGDVIRTYLNGVPAAVLVDGAWPEGFIGLQVHGVGDRADPLEVRWRSFRAAELE